MGDQGRVLSRAPVATRKLRVAAELGRLVDVVVELDGEGHRLRPKGKRPLLCWAPHAKALMWFEGVEPSRPQPALEGAAELARARAVREAWLDDGRDAARVRVLTVPSDKGDWYSMGPAVSVGYTSDKFAESGPRTYDHEHGPGARLYAFRGAEMTLYIIRGGRLRVTRRGIQG